MASKIIVIDGYIGPYGYSKQFIRNELAGQSKNPVLIKISSLGGSVDDALNIYDQLVEHGNVTVELSAFVASSATLVSLGAKTVRMNENSFYLIHKAMNWVDEWGRMNEDEIETLIAKLEAQKQQLAKITLQLAKMYAKKSGKTLAQVITLMKQETWLTAEEAKTWGFADEIFAPEVAVNYLDNLQTISMITSNGFPAPPRKAVNSQVSAEPVQPVQPVPTVQPFTVQPIQPFSPESFFDRLFNLFLHKQKELTPQNKIAEMKKQFPQINKTLNIQSLESSDDGIFLNEDQLQLIDESLEANQQLVAERDTAVHERETSSTSLTSVQASLASAYDLFNAIDPAIALAATAEAKVAAVRTLLAARPSAAPSQVLDQHDNSTSDEVNWEAINNLEHNKLVDANS